MCQPHGSLAGKQVTLPCAPCAVWRGASPRSGGARAKGPAGAQAPESAPPPITGAGLCQLQTCWSAGCRCARAGEPRLAFPGPARTGESAVTAAMAGAIAPARVPRRPLSSQGPKPPASARPATGGRWPVVGPGPAGLGDTVRRGRGNRDSRFLIPPKGRKRCPRFSGRGHRPCHSAALGSLTSRGPKPPASARPDPGGRFAPAGPGAGL